MFKKSRIKIIASIMAVLVLLLAGTLCVIYFTSYADVYRQNQEMLERYLGAYSVNGNPDRPSVIPDGKKPIKDAPLPDITDTDRFFQLSVFYSVAFSSDGSVVGIDDNNSDIYSDEQLTELAASVVQSQKMHGTVDGLIYRMENGENYTVVAFMDNTIFTESVTTLFRYTLIFGGVTTILIFFLSLYLAKRIVQPLEESYEKQKQFISDAGHELKTPVSVVNANAELLSREIGENKWLSNIQYENNRMAALIRQLMELARTESAAPHMEQVNLSRIVMGELLPFESVAFEKGLELSYDFITENVFVSGSSEQLRQLISILLDNAMEHSSAHGTITVMLTAKHNKARLSVSNPGEEIPTEQQKHIFDRFYRADFARNGDDNHYGLGLAIAKAIITAHNGEISVSCKDGLVTFSVLLPVRYS